MREVSMSILEGMIYKVRKHPGGMKLGGRSYLRGDGRGSHGAYEVRTLQKSKKAPTAVVGNDVVELGDEVSEVVEGILSKLNRWEGYVTLVTYIVIAFSRVRGVDVINLFETL